VPALGGGIPFQQEGIPFQQEFYVLKAARGASPPCILVKFRKFHQFVLKKLF
jgi:hypothetical protein